MNDLERNELTERSNVLRVELKSWEKTFAAANNGQKASRNDIKKNPDIGMISRRILTIGTYIENLSSCEIQRIQQSSRYPLRQNNASTSRTKTSNTPETEA